MEESILERFPKIRPELPPAYRAIYEAHYLRNRQGATAATSLSSLMEGWMHRVVAEDVREGKGREGKGREGKGSSIPSRSEQGCSTSSLMSR